MNKVFVDLANLISLNQSIIMTKLGFILSCLSLFLIGISFNFIIEKLQVIFNYLFKNYKGFALLILGFCLDIFIEGFIEIVKNAWN